MPILNGSDRDFQKSLMEKGLFPENLPPVFQVQNFFKVSDEQGLLNDDQMIKEPTRSSIYSETKRGGQRRIFSTPNPLFFIDAASYFKRYRNQIDECLKKSDYSCSIPEFDNDNERFVRIHSHAEFNQVKRSKLSNFRFIVKTDIARFYSSIYTHSIPWAVHGKAASKKDKDKNSTDIFTNKLDYLIRQSQDQQTIGIPVGPDTSKIICELIAGAVDEEFKKLAGDKVVGVRLVDDIYLGANSRDEAEKILRDYQHALRQYELDINENKTYIFDARDDLEAFWPVEIRREIKRVAVSKPNRSQRDDLTLYLDQIIRLANETRDDGIIKFAIRIIDQQRLWKDYWDSIEPFLVRVAIVFPHCVDFVARVVVWRHYRYPNSIDEQKWNNVCNEIISRHAPLGNDSEVIWLCWLMKEIKVKISSENCQKIIKHCGPFSALLIMDLNSNGLISGQSPDEAIEERFGEYSLLDNDWLLLFEAVRSFGYTFNLQNWGYYEVFKNLIDGGAQFYEPNALPAVFDGVDEGDFGDVELAIEDSENFYTVEEDIDYIDELFNEF